MNMKKLQLRFVNYYGLSLKPFLCGVRHHFLS